MDKLKLVDEVRALTKASYTEAKLALEKTDFIVESAVDLIENETSKSTSKEVTSKRVKAKVKELSEIFENIVTDASIPDHQKITIIIHSTSLICALIAIQPIPFADIFFLTPIQVVMVTYLNRVIGNPFDKNKVEEIVAYLAGVVGWGVLAQQLILGAYKTVIPYLGAITTIPLVYAANYALGIGAKAILESKVRNETLKKDELKNIMSRAKEEAKTNAGFEFSKRTLENEIKKLKLEVEEYKKYKEKLKELETFVDKSRNNNNEDASLEVSMIFEEKISFLKSRFEDKYGRQLWIHDSVFFTLALLPEQHIREIEYGISQLLQGNIYKLNYEVIDNHQHDLRINGLCNCYFHRKGKLYFLIQLLVDDEVTAKYPLLNLASTGKHRHLKNEEIRNYFEKAINESHNELLIISPWISTYVINGLKELLDEAINRGVTIKIIYGFGKDDRLVESRNAATELSNCYSGKIITKEMNTHYKLVISDNSFYIQGSYNFLSFGGQFTSNTRNEGAIYCTNKEEIQHLKDMYFKDV